MSKTLKIKHGTKSTMPILAQAEMGFVTDSGAEELWIGNGTENIEIARKDYVDGINAKPKTLIVTFSYISGEDKYVSDKTYAEVLNAYNSGWLIYAIYRGDILQLSGRVELLDMESGGVYYTDFCFSSINGDKCKQYTLHSNNSVEYLSTTYSTVDALRSSIETLTQQNAELLARIEALEAKANTFKFHVNGMGDGEGGGGYLEYTAEAGMTWAEFVASDYNYTRECMDQSTCDGEIRSFEIRGNHVYGFVDDICADCYASTYDEMWVCIDEGNGDGEGSVNASDVIRADATYTMSNP